MNKYILALITFTLSVTAVFGSRWSYTNDLIVGNSGFECVGFPDGRLMIMGGLNEFSSYQIFDPKIGKWTKTNLPSGSSHDLGILLYNGKVLYLDGSNFWFFQPDSNNWRSAGVSLPSWGKWNCYTLLKDGRVLIIYDGQNCQLYNYLSNTLSATGSTNVSHGTGVEVLLPNGKVLMAGGGPIGIRTCELYNPILGVWNITDSLTIRKTTHVGVLLPPPWNKVLMTGKKAPSDLYDLATEKWSASDTMEEPDATIEALALLPNGKVLVAGGSDLSTCRLFDPATEQWTTVDPMNKTRDHFSLSLLYTGKVLAMGTQASSFPPQCEIYDPSNGVWQTKAEALNTARQYATTTILPIKHTNNCSTNVLISGGENAGGTALNSCELYNYKTEIIAFTGSLNTARTHHTAVLLASTTGEVLAAGGKNTVALNSCEIFDQTTQIWNSTGAMTDARFDHSATLLADGRVLVTGGEGASYLNTCEVFNGSTWSSAGTMTTARARHSVVLLLNGNIMVIGGETTGGTPTATCEIWNGTDWTTVPAASMTTARSLHTATLLQSGKVLVVGGKGAGGSALNSCEIYDPTTNTWTAETNLNTARYGHNTILLYSGIVLVTGGTDGTSYFASSELWDPAAELDRATGKHGWKVSANLGTGRAYHSSILVPYLKPYVYTIGGSTGGSVLSSVEQYDIGLGYQSIWQSTITNYKSVTQISPTMNMSGTLLRGVSEADGGNYCHVASNDHPIISLVRAGGGNWQGNGGGEIMLMPHSVSWDSAHTNVVGLPTVSGYYRLWSIVNGIPCKWDWNCSAGTEETQNSKVNPPQADQRLEIYPNPATTSVNFKLSLNNGELDISLRIYDLSGRLIKNLAISPNRKSSVTTSWNGIDNTGKRVKSGIYFYSIKCKDSEYRGKFTILK
ncbi:MAG: kelch repeat-containing protein [bacterium]|nr:kelch repeat-containing protein [bacterium]